MPSIYITFHLYDLRLIKKTDIFANISNKANHDNNKFNIFIVDVIKTFFNLIIENHKNVSINEKIFDYDFIASISKDYIKSIYLYGIKSKHQDRFEISFENEEKYDNKSKTFKLVIKPVNFSIAYGADSEIENITNRFHVHFVKNLKLNFKKEFNVESIATRYDFFDSSIKNYVKLNQNDVYTVLKLDLNAAETLTLLLIEFLKKYQNANQQQIEKFFKDFLSLKNKDTKTIDSMIFEMYNDFLKFKHAIKSIKLAILIKDYSKEKLFEEFNFFCHDLELTDEIKNIIADYEDVICKYAYKLYDDTFKRINVFSGTF